MILNGKYGRKSSEQLIPVSDGAGEVVAIGKKVKNIKIGDKVCVSFFSSWISGQFSEQYFGSDLGGGCNGTLAEYGAFSANALVKIPNEWTYKDASCLPCAGVTAWNAIVEFGLIDQKKSVLLLGTGGVSIFGLQIAKNFNSQIIITSSNDNKLKTAKQLGADICINYKTNDDWEKAVLDATNGKGADIIVETGGPASLQKSFSAASFNSRISLIGNLAGNSKEPINTIPMVGKNITLRGITVGNKKMLEDLAENFSNASVKPIIDKDFHFDKSLDAFRYLESQKHIGKIVISNR